MNLLKFLGNPLFHSTFYMTLPLALALSLKPVIKGPTFNFFEHESKMIAGEGFVGFTFEGDLVEVQCYNLNDTGKADAYALYKLNFRERYFSRNSTAYVLIMDKNEDDIPDYWLRDMNGDGTLEKKFKR